MAIASSMIFVSFLCFLVVSASACDRCLHQTKAAFFYSDEPLYYGACGYGSLAVDFNGGYVAGAVQSIYKNGASCGACIQIRCKDPNICRKTWTNIIITDRNDNNEIGLVLSQRAFNAMANASMERELIIKGIVEVEYRRVPCEYKQNLAVRVEELSHKPYHLAVKFLYQGGQTEIVGVDVAKVGSSNWEHMSRNYGAVWDTSRVPEGPLQFRWMITAGYVGKYVWAKNVLPQDWMVGQVYDTGVQITDIAHEGCLTCDESEWK